MSNPQHNSCWSPNIAGCCQGRCPKNPMKNHMPATPLEGGPTVSASWGLFSPLSSPKWPRPPMETTSAKQEGGNKTGKIRESSPRRKQIEEQIRGFVTYQGRLTGRIRGGRLEPGNWGRPECSSSGKIGTWRGGVDWLWGEIRGLVISWFPASSGERIPRDSPPTFSLCATGSEGPDCSPNLPKTNWFAAIFS